MQPEALWAYALITVLLVSRLLPKSVLPGLYFSKFFLSEPSKRCNLRRQWSIKESKLKRKLAYLLMKLEKQAYQIEK